MSSPRVERLSAQQRRVQILKVAREEFLTRGYSGARIQEMARNAGVTNALIYKHFDSKDDLYEHAVMAPLHRRLEERFAEMRSLPVDVDGLAQHESMHRWVRVLLELFTESIESIGVILFGERDHATHFYQRHVRPLIEASIEVGEVNLARWPHRDYSIETAVQAAIGAAAWLAIDHSMRGEMDDLDKRAAELTDVIMHGVARR